MYMTGFPNCCGARIITHFGGANRMRPSSVQEVNAFLENSVVVSKQKAMLMCILTGKQKKRYEGVLKQHGFKVVAWGNNRPHRSKNYLFVREHQTGKK